MISFFPPRIYYLHTGEGGNGGACFIIKANPEEPAEMALGGGLRKHDIVRN